MNTLDALYEKRNRMQDELDGLKPEYQRSQDEGILERMSNLKAGLVGTQRDIIGELAKDPAHRIAGAEFPVPGGDPPPGQRTGPRAPRPRVAGNRGALGRDRKRGRRPADEVGRARQVRDRQRLRLFSR
jgi:hypothetical protein